jgi:hypothetical protein
MISENPGIAPLYFDRQTRMLSSNSEYPAVGTKWLRL